MANFTVFTRFIVDFLRVGKHYCEWRKTTPQSIIYAELLNQRATVRRALGRRLLPESGSS